MSIKDLPINLRPREKAFLSGLSSLNDIEILALFLASGTKNKDALTIAKILFEKFQSFKNIVNASLKELKEVEGIGKVKALFIKNLNELNKRMRKNIFAQNELKNFDLIVQKSIDLLSTKSQEEFLVFFLDQKKQVLSYQILYKGTRWSVAIEPHEILKAVLKKDSYYFYCFHNHPSGNVLPSQQDIEVSKRIANYGKLFGIKMLGHYIVNKKRNYHQIKW